MTHLLQSLVAAAVRVGVWTDAAHANIRAFSSKVLPDPAGQVVAGFPASGVDWAIRDGRGNLFALGADRVFLTLRVRGLITPAFGFNLAGDLLARVVCYDESGEPFVADTTRATTNFTPSGGGLLLDRVELPEGCFALIGGSVGPGGERPSSWFASSGF